MFFFDISRFMPEPNLPPLRLTLEGPESENRNVLSVERIRKSLPEMPDKTRERLVRDFSIPIDFAVRFVNDPPLLNFFLEAVKFNPKNIKVTTIWKERHFEIKSF